MRAPAVLTLNAGSSSIKFALFDDAKELGRIAHGQVESIGRGARLLLTRADGTKSRSHVAAADHDGALRVILDVVKEQLSGREVAGVGHRITHGGPEFAAPRELDPQSMARLRDFMAWAPLHQPYNLAVVDGARAAFPGARQVGCFDTAFHHGHGFAADAYALPLRYYEDGIRRYGFHGLSYQYVSERLTDVAPDIATGRVIIAHLGNGASMCALDGGRSVASTMGFTALDGLAMGTRCGQVDPGVLLYLLQQGLDASALADLLYRQSGLLGLSGLSSDMRVLLADTQTASRQAVDYFVHRAKSEIGSLSAILGGLDALVFCGGIGENASAVRARICSGLSFLGIEIDDAANAADAQDIGAGASRVLVIPTDEELVIARSTRRLISN